MLYTSISEQDLEMEKKYFFLFFPLVSVSIRRRPGKPTQIALFNLEQALEGNRTRIKFIFKRDREEIRKHGPVNCS